MSNANFEVPGGLGLAVATEKNNDGEFVATWTLMESPQGGRQVARGTVAPNAQEAVAREQARVAGTVKAMNLASEMS